MFRGVPARHYGALSAPVAPVWVRVATVVSPGFSCRTGALRVIVIGVRDGPRRSCANRLSISDRQQWPCTFSSRPYAFYVSCRRCRRGLCVRPSCQRPKFIVILRRAVRLRCVHRRYVITAVALVVVVISSLIRVPTRNLTVTLSRPCLPSAPPSYRIVRSPPPNIPRNHTLFAITVRDVPLSFPARRQFRYFDELVRRTRVQRVRVADAATTEMCTSPLWAAHVPVAVRNTNQYWKLITMLCVI